MPYVFVRYKFGSSTLVVIIIVHNLVVINVVLLIMWKFQYFACFRLKMLIRTPKSFGGFYPLHRELGQRDPKMHTFNYWSLHHLSHT